MLHAAMNLSPRGSEGAPALPRPLAGDRGGAPAEVEGQGELFEEAAALRPAVRALIACVLGRPFDHPDVEDCAHEALARAFEGRARLRDGEPLRPWVLGIARHVALDALRRKKRDRDRRVATHEGDDGGGAGGASIEAVEDPAPGPEERAASAEQGRRVQAALGLLAGPQREALVAFHVEGQSYQEISRRLGIPLGTVATWIARGRRSLAEALGE